MSCRLRIGNETWKVPRKKGSPFREVFEDDERVGGTLEHTPVTDIRSAVLNGETLLVHYTSHDVESPKLPTDELRVNTTTGDVLYPGPGHLVVVYESHDLEEFFEHAPWE